MIRVFFPGDTWIDLPEETPADPYGPPVEDEKPLTLEWTRDHNFGVALVFLRGTWLAGRVETWPEEARRLRAERDAAEKRGARWKRLAKQLRFVLAGAEQDTAHLRRGAVAMIGALSDEGTDVKPSSLAASLVVWAEHVREQRGRLEAAEKRIADLRTWAEKEADAWDAMADILDVSPGGSAWHLVVGRIDGKAG